MNLKYFYNLLFNLFRLNPIIIIYYIIINILINPSYNNIILLILIIYDKILNTSLKTLFEYLYDYMNIDYMCILGIGKRPSNIISLDNNSNDMDEKNNTYGMPSGHCQNSFLFSTYLIFNIISIYKNKINNYYINILYKFLGIIIIISYSLFIIYSRVYEKYHTIQQCILGSVIGIILGILYYIIIL